MKSLLKVMLILTLVFASTFIIAKTTGFLSVEKIEQLLIKAQSISVWYIAGIVMVLLFSDLFIAVPTLTIILLSGFFLGPLVGFLAAIVGLLMAGLSGYILSFIFGDKVLNLIIKDPVEQKEARNTFLSHGFMTILLSRAMPILPEVCACMAGVTKMPLLKFLSAWLISSVPYALIASYAGSISSVDNPKPAIFAAIGLTIFFWTCWAFFKYKLAAE